MMADTYTTVARHVVVKGLVQGVFFRAFTRDLGQSLGVRGHVKNLPDGTVEVLVEGTPARVQKFLDGLRKGPPGARVEEMVVEEVEPKGLDGPFEIRY